MSDLLLVDGLLRIVQPKVVRLHAKDRPVFVSDVTREALQPEALPSRLHVPHPHGPVARRTDHLVGVTLQRRHDTWLGLGLGLGLGPY